MKKMSFVVAVVVTASFAIAACGGKKKGAETPATGSGSAMTGSDTGSAAGSGETPAAGSGDAAGSAAM